jgi:uncharacterized membrane protein
MSLFYLLAGVNHFINPETYLRIMPSWLPWARALVLMSGAAEMILAVLLLPHASRRFAAWGIIVLLITVFPANVQMAVNYVLENNRWTWMALLRLPLQLLLIYWAFTFTGHKQRLRV